MLTDSSNSNTGQVPLELAPNRDKMGGVLKYLTFLNMLLQVDHSLMYLAFLSILLFFGLNHPCELVLLYEQNVLVMYS